jgi:hypothetical protein
MPMSDTFRAYYNRAFFLPRYLGLCGLILLTVFEPFDDSTYMKFFLTPPGEYLVYAVTFLLAVEAVRLMPIFFMALFKIPAVEFDGRKLVVKGWFDKTFVPIDDKLSFRDEAGRVLLSSESGVKASIVLAHIEGPRTLLNFFQNLQLQSS